MIKRGVRSEKFTVVSNTVLEDPSIDWRDLGLLVFLLSKPDHWEVSPKHLSNVRKSGRDAIYSSLNRLISSGYVTRQKNADGSMDYVVFDTPQIGDPITENPEQGEPDPENPDPEKPTQVNTEYTHTHNARVRERLPPPISEDFNLDAEVRARMFSSGVSEPLALFFVDEFREKNISTGFCSFNWAAEFVSYCKRHEWRFKKHEQSNSGKQTGGNGVSAKPATGFGQRIRKRLNQNGPVSG